MGATGNSPMYKVKVTKHKRCRQNAREAPYLNEWFTYDFEVEIRWDHDVAWFEISMANLQVGMQVLQKHHKLGWKVAD